MDKTTVAVRIATAFKMGISSNLVHHMFQLVWEALILECSLQCCTQGRHM